MVKEIRTEYGLIDISKDVIATLAGLATTECFGIVGVTNSGLSDGIAVLLGKESLSRGVEVQSNEQMLNIRVNVVVSYGSRISVVANNVIDRVKYTVEKYTGLTVGSVDVRVQGVRVLD